MPRYFLTVLFIFWIPSVFLYFFLRNKLTALKKKSFWINLAIWCPVTFAAEYLYLWADIWNFSEEFDPLLGISIFGAPIEEFAFWFGAPVFFTLLYLAFSYIDRRYFRGFKHVK